MGEHCLSIKMEHSAEHTVVYSNSSSGECMTDEWANESPEGSMEISGAHWPSSDDVSTTARSFLIPGAEINAETPCEMKNIPPVRCELKHMCNFLWYSLCEKCYVEKIVIQWGRFSKENLFSDSSNVAEQNIVTEMTDQRKDRENKIQNNGEEIKAGARMRIVYVETGRRWRHSSKKVWISRFGGAERHRYWEVSGGRREGKAR